ncbi:TPA_asm: coat protein [ssRNA phage Gerhypos.1_45]|uniref:Coat protein n=2 Tax=Leviviricetes TaxID=2842243 RepID=A0A8S5L370_9VIRU|nr:coat protein [ssRNA phage Gerhypos.1_45]QDH86504.1 MAG: hypothetical protein H1Bulk30256_000002 [Leviviridae sp.]DAD52230.1 TPA_asm: coat protein [ssRNA phage Gerhypos.1_45]
MSLGTSLALSKDSPTDVDTNLSTFDLRAADLNRSEYSVAGLTLPSERKLTVSHDTGKGGEQRHLVRIDDTVVDTALVPATMSVYLVIVRPPNTAVTNALLIENVNRLVDFAIEGGVNGNITKILNSEV